MPPSFSALRSTRTDRPNRKHTKLKSAQFKPHPSSSLTHPLLFSCLPLFLPLSACSGYSNFSKPRGLLSARILTCLTNGRQNFDRTLEPFSERFTLLAFVPWSENTRSCSVIVSPTNFDISTFLSAIEFFRGFLGYWSSRHASKIGHFDPREILWKLVRA